MAKKKKVLGAMISTLGLIKRQESFVLEELGHLELMQDLLARAIRYSPEKIPLLRNTRVSKLAKKAVHKKCHKILRNVQKTSSQHHRLANKVLKQSAKLFVFCPHQHRSVLKLSGQKTQIQKKKLDSKRRNIVRSFKSSNLELDHLHQQVTKVIQTGVEPLLSAVRKQQTSFKKIN